VARDGEKNALFLLFVNRNFLVLWAEIPLGFETAGEIIFSAHAISEQNSAAGAPRSRKTGY
jgi:hypothetical protein